MYCTAEKVYICEKYLGRLLSTSQEADDETYLKFRSDVTEREFYSELSEKLDNVTAFIREHLLALSTHWEFEQNVELFELREGIHD